MAAGRVRVNGQVCVLCVCVCWCVSFVFSSTDVYSNIHPPSVRPFIHPSPPPPKTKTNQVAEPGTRVQPGDRVTLDGKAVEWETHVVLPKPEGGERGEEEEGVGLVGGARGRVYIKYWKPR